MKNKVICFGEALWDIYSGDKKIGGAPLNVAYHLDKLGVGGQIITRIGNDNAGIELRKEIEAMGLSTAFCQEDTKYPTGVVIAEMDENFDMIYEIVFPAAWDFIEWNREVDEFARNSTALVFGSLASRNEISYNTLQKLMERSAFRVFDLNFRFPFVEREKVEKLMINTDLLKLNVHELDVLSQWNGIEGKAEEVRVNFIQERYSISEVLLTKGAGGAIYFEGEKVYYYQAPKVKVVNTIGSGDAFLAGFLASKLKEEADVATQLKIAGNLAAFVTTQSGACPDYSGDPLEITLMNHSNE